MIHYGARHQFTSDFVCVLSKTAIAIKFSTTTIHHILFEKKGMPFMNTQSTSVAAIQTFMQRTFLWMSAALALSGTIAFAVFNTPALMKAISSPWVFFTIFLAELGLVIALSSAVRSFSYTRALTMFALFAALNGLTLSSIFAVYTMTSIVSTFFITAALFLSMALYGMVTKRDLTSLGSIASMFVWGLIIAMLVNMFLRSGAFDYVISIIGVCVFSALTAYDMQKLLKLAEGVSTYQRSVFQDGEYLESGSDHAPIKSVAVLGALTLYLDFINMFLFLLRFVGNNRRSN